MLLAQRDPTSFELIYERYVDRIYRYCLRRLNDPREAEDLTSQVFTRALTMLGSYRGGMVSAWLFQIAANAVTDYLRQRRPQVSLDDLEIAHHAESPIDQIVAEEDIERIRELLKEISPEQRELLDLKLSGGLNSEEIGQVVGKSATAVRSILHRVLRRLHHMYHQTEESEVQP